MAVEKAEDPYDLIGNNFPEGDETKFATSAATLADKVAHHSVTASEYRSAITGLCDDVFQGLLADATREELGKVADRHDEEEQYCRKLSEVIGNCGMQILLCKNEINAHCVTATGQITQLQLQKGSAEAIDAAKKQARDDISSLHDQLEGSLTDAKASMQMWHDQIAVSSMSVEGKKQPDASLGSHTGAPDISQVSFDGARAGGAPGAVDGAAVPGTGSSGAEALSNSATPVNPASLMGAMPQQMPAMPQMPGGMPGGGGMGSQLPGQELASKAMDMAQNMDGKDSTFLSDSSVKDLLAGAGDHGGGDRGVSVGADSGHSGENAFGDGPGSVDAGNPTVASGPSPAAPVSSARPTGGPSVAMTELAGGPASSGPVSGLTSAASGISGLTGGPVTHVAAAASTVSTAAVNAAAGNAANTGSAVPMGFTPSVGSVAVPSTAGGFGSPPSLAPPAATAPVTPAPPAPPSAPVTPVAAPSAPPVAAPPTVAGFNAVPASMGSAPSGILDLFAPSAMLAVMSAAPARLESLPVEQRITILNAAAIVTQMRERGWPASVATALVNDGVNVAVVIATADDLSILPADITIPRASILLHRFGLGERFRSEWAGNADTISKIVAAVDSHPWLDRSMIKHACAFTRNTEIRDPAVPFTPISMDAAWVIRYLYTPPRETVPAYTLRAETFTEDQINYLLGVAVRRWQLPTIRLRRKGQARLESASMFASRWSTTGEAQQKSSPRGYDSRIAGYLYAATREALLEGDVERASWYGQYLRYHTLPTVNPLAA
jgi:hypothetical protein